MSLPTEYLETMKNMLGDDLDSYLESFHDVRQYGLRINNLKISTEDFLKISPFSLKPIPWIENGFYFGEEDKPAKHPYYFAGLYYIQEPSAMTPANVFPVKEGDRVLDMCAAPGGKSTELASRLNRTGLLVSNDISGTRAKALLKNIEMAGIPNSMVLNEDPKKLAGYYEAYFDKILIDAPCSGEGMFRKDARLIKSWKKNGPDFYHKIQKELLLSGADMLKPNGMLLYSTCTFSRLEDEESVKYLLKNRPDMVLTDAKQYSGFSPGFADTEEDKQMGLSKCIRIWPHKMQGEGHFAALFQKQGEPQNYFLKQTRSPGNIKLPVELTEFLKQVSYPIDLNDIRIVKDLVFVVPKDIKNFEQCKKLRTGLILGELKKDRFEPYQAFAMALKAQEFDSVIDLSVEYPNVIKYLKCETIEVDTEHVKRKAGWQLVCVEGYPLGWGKLNGTTLKNKYMPAWRWM